jgi:dTDP-4-amino-4,6-dideoxygalactose transaminase
MTATRLPATLQIPFFNYPKLYAEHRAEYLEALDQAMARGAFIMQRDLQEFEAELASYLGVKHVIGLADGTVAITLALHLAGVGPGDEVILPSHTFVATAAAVHHVGAIPVLCDCGPDHLIDVESARPLVTSRTKAILPVQLNGRVADMTRVMAFAHEHGLKVVEDSCQAVGAKFNGQVAGSFGVAGTCSFYPAKTLGCFGDGGALLVNDDALASLAREYRDHGRGATGKVERFGYNGRLDNLQAVILRIKLRHYDAAIARRRAIAAQYHAGLSDVAGLVLPPAPNEDPRHFDIFQNYEIESDARDALRAHLTSRGIGTLLQWGGYMIHQFDALGLRAAAPFAERLSTRYLMLPMHHLLEDDEVAYVIEAVRAFHGA